MQITPELLSHRRRAAETDIPRSPDTVFFMLQYVNGADAVLEQISYHRFFGIDAAYSDALLLAVKGIWRELRKRMWGGRLHSKEWMLNTKQACN